LSLFAGGREAVLGLHGRKLGLLLVRVQLLEGLVGLVVEDDEVSVANVEAAQVVARVLGVEDVFVDDESCAASFRSVAAVRDVDFNSSLIQLFNLDRKRYKISESSEGPPDSDSFRIGQGIGVKINRSDNWMTIMYLCVHNAPFT